MAERDANGDSDGVSDQRLDDARVIDVAIDVGPLHGRRTGIGNAVAWMVDALDAQPTVALHPYVTSMRARPGSTTDPDRHHFRRLPLPAALAIRWWSRPSPPLDRLLGGPDVVHGTNYVVPPTRCPRIVSVYDCWFLDHPDQAAPDVRRAGAVLQRAVDQGATVLACSHATATRAREVLGTDRVRTVLLGPPPPIPDRSTPPDGFGELGAPFLLTLGTVERRKNIPVLVAAFARVAAEHETVRLVIAGSPGDDSAAVQRALDGLDQGVARRVVLIGPVDTPTKTWLLANARALAYPSLDEGFGFPILEAQQMGLPVVASAAGSIPEIAGNAALLSSPTDVDALAAHLHWALTSDDKHAQLVERGRHNLERFSWTDTAHQLAELYAEVANGATP